MSQAQSSLSSRGMLSVAGAQIVKDAMDKMRNLGQSERQRRLSGLWAWYRAENYAVRKFDWDGKEHLEALDREAVSSGSYLPPGFYDASGSNLPLKYRRPTAPYALGKVIVDRFTGMLFSQRRHPKLRVEGDPDTEDFVTTLVECARLWTTMIQARAIGGAMGTVCLGFQFIDGNPVIEVHDPRWTTPEFEDRLTMKLKSIEIRYIFEKEERDPDTGIFETISYWYRRIVDDEKDTLFEEAMVLDGREPEWAVAKEVEHGFGFCPAVWVQNLPVNDEIDGDPDCLGIYDMIEAIDMLVSQAHRGTVHNCDPTLVTVSDQEMEDATKGTGNGLQVPAGGDIKYLEITGQGPKAAWDAAEILRKYALEVAQCVLEHAEMSQRTATEIERVYAAMISKGDMLREQYGEKGIKPLAIMMIKAAKAVGMARRDVNSNEIIKGKLALPQRVQDKGGDGNAQRVDRKLGWGGELKLQWPGYFEPMPQEILQSTQAAVAAKTGGLIDQEHATKFVADYFNVENVSEMLVAVKKEAQEQQALLEEQMMAGMKNTAPPEK